MLYNLLPYIHASFYHIQTFPPKIEKLVEVVLSTNYYFLKIIVHSISEKI